MVAISFSSHPSFPEKIKKGIKIQTCRKNLRFKVGDKLQLYWRQRTSDCFKIADAICTDIFLKSISANIYLYH